MAVERSLLVTALVQDAGFINRLQALLSKIAFQELARTMGGDLEVDQAFAAKVIAAPRTYATNMAPYLMNTDNFVGEDIEIAPAGSGFTITIATTDAAAESQIFTVWTDLAELFG